MQQRSDPPIVPPKRAYQVLSDILMPVPARAPAWRAVEVVGFGVGCALCFSWLRSIAGAGGVVVAGVFGAAAYFVMTAAKRVALRRTAGAAIVFGYVLTAYVFVALTTVLAWTLPLWVIAVAAVLAAVCAAGALGRWRGPRAALCLPLGVWITALLVGWLREDGRVRCEDHQRVAHDPAVRIVVPTSTELSSCQGDEVLLVGRYPRGIWQSQDSNELVFTTQPGIQLLPSGRSVAEELAGSVCAAPIDGSRPPVCLGTGKAQAIAESERHDRLFIAAWGRFERGKRGRLYAVTRRPPLRLLGETLLDVQTGELFYDEPNDVLGLFSDEGDVLVPVQAATLTPLPAVPAEVIPGDVRYDAQRGEGVLCFAAGPLKPVDGSRYASLAFRASPLSFRPLAPSGSHPSSWLALTWGCDWDPAARRVYVALADFGLLATIDYDSGRVLDRAWVGFGARAVELDRRTGRAYIANFLNGVVIEWDTKGSRELRRWFVGRFVRGLTLARDGASLFVASNVGVVQIRL